MSETRVVVVGAGKMGAHHARVFAQASGARLAGVLDVERARAEHVASSSGSTALRNFDEALERAELVVLATPTALHYAQARRAIESGRSVLVEKPLAATAAEARALCEAAEGRGVGLLVGHSERFNAVVRTIAHDSERDHVLDIATHRTAAAPDEDLCTNLAVHDIDLAALLARSPVDVVAASGTPDDAQVVLRAGSAAVHARVTRGVARRVRLLHMKTTRADYEGDLATRTLLRDGQVIAVGGGEPLALQAAAALAVMRGEPSTIALGEDGLRAVAVAERAALALAAHAGPAPLHF